MKFKSLLLSTLLLLSTFDLPLVAEEQKAVLITGATSGIGRAAAERLAKNGYYVYAGARKDSDMAELNKIPNITAVRLDVTNQEQVDAAVEFIKAQKRGLWGVVNNAGVNVVAPMIVAKESDFRFIFDVNVFGVYRVTKAFAPMIMDSKGRIVNISSISGVLSGGGYGMYAASKHALEAMTHSLARELERFDVHVSAVNPGNFASEIGLTRCKRLVKTQDDENWGQFEQRRQNMIKGCKERLEAGVAGEGTPPDAVAETIEMALFDKQPKDRYLIVPEQREAGWTISWGIDEIMQLNSQHKHSYTRDELVALIDQSWPYYNGEKSFDNEAEDKEFMEFLMGWINREKSE